MAFDIYGDVLRRGHCEVHPHVHEDYPCGLCLAESTSKKQLEREYAKQCEQEANDYYAGLYAEYLWEGGVGCA